MLNTEFTFSTEDSTWDATPTLAPMGEKVGRSVDKRAAFCFKNKYYHFCNVYHKV